jgi:Di-N-acetylchitobiase
MTHRWHCKISLPVCPWLWHSHNIMLHHQRPHKLFFFFFLLVSLLAYSNATCPCDDDSLCDTIGGPPVRPSGEIYGFYRYNGNTNPLPPGHDFNWTHVTTVAWASDEVMCLAHQHGARAILGAPPIANLTAMVDNPSVRQIWIQEAVDQVLSTHRDGIVFDYELPIASGSPEGEAYAQLVAETRNRLQQVNPSFQVTTCVAWSPNNIDERAYPYPELADASDLLYVMDYDTRSQIYGDCIAGANAPFPGMIDGMEDWFHLGIPPEKFILGVPWYGYKYPCLPGTAEDAMVCPIQPVPFRGANCSDAAGSQVPHAEAIRVIQKHNATVRREESSQTLFFNVVEEEGVVVQYWMEDPYLLRKKCRWAKEQGLAGVGPYNFQYLDPVTQEEESAAMWSAFDEFMVRDPFIHVGESMAA